MADTIEGAFEALAAAESDVRADFGEEALEGGYSDVVAAVAVQYPSEVAIELCRRTMGWLPQDVVRELRRRGDEVPDEDWI